MNVEFRKGVYHFNEESNFDFQLNRTVMWDGGDPEELMEVSAGIRTSDDWKRTLIGLGERAESEGRIPNAVAYYRMSEFFMYDGDPDKKKYYLKATEMFYSHYADLFQSEEVGRTEVPFEEVQLPVMYRKARGEEKDVILLHGGNDSYFEEFFFPMLYLSDCGFTVYVFEGPGQGGVLRRQGKKFTYEWERPVKAVLDHFGLEEVTMIGASLGGMLAPRAAAFEPRIRRVIAWSIFPNGLEVLLSTSDASDDKKVKWVRRLLKYNCRRLVNALVAKAAREEELVHWGIEHGKYAYDAKDAFDYLKKMEKFQMTDIADKITQDFYLAGANRDHFIPYHMVGEEILALKNVRSLTFRLFTDKESAGNHCNCGNTKLVLDSFMNWITEIKKRE